MNFTALLAMTVSAISEDNFMKASARQLQQTREVEFNAEL